MIESKVRQISGVGIIGRRLDLNFVSPVSGYVKMFGILEVILLLECMVGFYINNVNTTV